MDEDKGKHKYLSYCIPAGLLVGTVVAVVGSFDIGICTGIGMLLGVVVGSTIDYEVDNKKQ